MRVRGLSRSLEALIFLAASLVAALMVYSYFSTASRAYTVHPTVTVTKAEVRAYPGETDVHLVLRVTGGPVNITTLEIDGYTCTVIPYKVDVTPLSGSSLATIFQPQIATLPGQETPTPVGVQLDPGAYSLTVICGPLPLHSDTATIYIYTSSGDVYGPFIANVYRYG